MLKTILLSLLVAPGARAASPEKFDKAVVVILENTDYQAAIKEPFLLGLSTRGALLADSHAVAHPSLPNYIALVSGQIHGIKDDGKYDLDGRSLADLLEAKGKTWKVYAEGYPGHCYLKQRARRFARKHTPLLSFKNIQSAPARCADVVAAPQFFKDFAAGQLPDFSLYIPDLDDDGHDTGVAYADKWLRRAFGPVVAKLPQGLLLVVTFDEDSNSGGTNQIYTSLNGSMVVPGARAGERLTHYDLLRTFEDNWGLGTLGAEDARAKPITGVWK